MVPLAPMMNSEQVREMVEGAKSNSQVWDAGGTSQIMAELFDLTEHCRIDTQEAWLEVATFTTGRRGGYGDLTTKMTQAGIWPLNEDDETF